MLVPLTPSRLTPISRGGQPAHRLYRISREPEYVLDVESGAVSSMQPVPSVWVGRVREEHPPVLPVDPKLVHPEPRGLLADHPFAKTFLAVLAGVVVGGVIYDRWIRS